MKFKSLDMKLAAVTFASATLLTIAANAQTVGIGTTGPGSFTHSSGSAMAKVIAEKAGLNLAPPHWRHRVATDETGDDIGPAGNRGQTDIAFQVIHQQQPEVRYRHRGALEHHSCGAEFYPREWILWNHL